MEPPQPQPPAHSNTAPPLSHYSDSANSSPRSRSNETWDPAAAAGADHQALPSKLRLMCSYGGHIVPRPHDKSLCYVGGETRIVVVDRHVTSLSTLAFHLSKTLLNNRSFTLKYQLPNEDLDSLITVSTDEDFENMIDEHDRVLSNPSLKQSRLRLFLFPLKLESAQSNIGPILDSSTKSDDWFLTALNRGFSDSAPVNTLVNLDDDITAIQGNSADSSGGRDEKGAKQDIHSVPDSPMLDTTSSFGSTSSSPYIVNLPSIQVRVEETGGQKLGIEEQFANMVMVTGVGQKHDEGLFVLNSQPPPMPSALPIPSSGVVTGGEFVNRVVSDDERSDHGAPMAYRKLVQVQQQQPQALAAPQSQQKPTGFLDLSSPDSVSSDNSFTSAMSRPKSGIYQDQVSPAMNMNRVPSNHADPMVTISDPNTGMQIQQQQQQQHVGEASGYVMQQQTPQQQFIQSGTPQYVHHPVTAYYSVYPPPPQQQQHHHLQQHHQQLDQQYPFYYMPVAEPQNYNMSSDPSKTNPPQNHHHHHPQTPLGATMVHQPPTSYSNPVRTTTASSAKPEMYRVATSGGGGGGPQLVQVQPSSQQQQFVGYHHHPSQSIAPNSAAAAAYGYEYANAAPSQIYYTAQQTLPSQYKTLSAGGVLPDASCQVQTDAVKQQQIRTSQPL